MDQRQERLDAPFGEILEAALMISVFSPTLPA
jgi:hypothetical protein